jgi:hypothetical protein
VLAWLLAPGQLLVWAFAAFTVLLLARFVVRFRNTDD